MNARFLLLPAIAVIALTAIVSSFVPAAQAEHHEKVLRHVVLFKFKDSASEAQVKEIADAFAGLPGQIDTIVDFEWGTNVSPEGKNQGFTHLFFVSFKDMKGLEAYLPHEAHQNFVSLLKPQLEDVLVFDYYTGG